MTQRLLVLTPSFKPVGGVRKIFDYAMHALQLGLEVVVYSPQPYDGGEPLFASGTPRSVMASDAVVSTTDHRLTLDRDDLALISWPKHYELLADRFLPGTAHERVIHIVQNVRHANPAWSGGYALRLLGRPMTRIAINDVVLEAIEPYVNRDSLTRVIPLAHDVDYFWRDRADVPRHPVRVAYATWKSQLGDRVAERLASDDRFEFRSITTDVAWAELCHLYHWADVFMCTPNAEEGFYLPGLEAMAAGCIVLTPDAVGNRVYCDFGSNCLRVELEDDASYCDALVRLTKETATVVSTMRAAGYETARRHDLAAERAQFAELLCELGARVSSAERV